MKKNILKVSLLSFFCFSSFAQTKDDVAKIIKNYDVETIKEKAIYFESLEKREKEVAVAEALKKGWPIIVQKEDGTYEELMRLTSDGVPVYFASQNANAAKSTRAVHLNSGGTLGLNLNGENMVARVWDGGTVRRTHNLFENRVTTVDDVSGTTYSSHATHVTGTILASDASASTKGMAYNATGRTFNWTNDESEATNEVLGGMLISNHSYGVPITSSSGAIQPAWYIGSYTSAARNWDEISYLAPYYLPVMSAGNDGNNNDNSNPIANGFDKLTSDKTAKNSLIVANAQDANVSPDGTLNSVSISSSSSQGPTDDRRIKPDITGNGVSLTSTDSGSDTATGTKSGTSMASPNVAGTLLLVQQHYKNVTNSFMKAATLKGLACHTADDAGAIGPDAKFGWGLLNAKAAAETITNNGLTSWVSEEELMQSQTFTMTVKSNGGTNNPLIASITWTDVPGVAKTNTVENDPLPVLVNNLDIKVTRNGTIYYPWRLESNPNVPATRLTDNNVDNVEVVRIDAPDAGDYVITVTHKGNLVNNKQDYSLVVTGISSGFSLTSKSDNLIVCDTQDAIYTFDYKQTGAGTTNFSATGLPAGANVVFSPASLNTNGTVTMTLSNLTNVAPGEYNVGIQGDNGIETEIRTKNLKIYSANFQPVVLDSPVNSQNTVATTVTLKWVEHVNVESYNLQVSTSPSLATPLVNEIVAGDSFLVTGLNEETNYYWRVIPSNRCGTDLVTNATVYNFETGKLTCGSSFSATDFSNNIIEITANSIATVPIEVSGGIVIGDLNVALDLTHTYIQDMTYYLEGPASIGSPVVTLFKQPCGSEDDINCTIDDSGANFTCSGTAPAISGTVKPFETLSAFNGLVADGTWILRVEDPFNGDGGTINAVTLSFCNIEQALSIESNVLSNVRIYPNPAKSSINIDLNNSITGEVGYALYDIQGRLILNKKSSTAITNLNVENLTEGVYLLVIETENVKITKKIVVKR
ncbi:S8 family serine peptidase [Flavobacterium sp.]|uniref:S8 family serine peptidase n=1 Tax=Flavobacterium sp. TaxID=239 RepID=UPI0040485D97